MEMLDAEQGTMAFMAPELLFSAKFGLEKGVPSKEADIYALGMTVYQVLTDERPFFSKKGAEIALAVISGERPPKPENAESIGITEAVWDLVRECWREDRATRPNILNVLGRFRRITGEGKFTDSTTEVPGLRPDTGFNRDSIHSETTAVQCEWSDSSFERSYPTRL